MSRADRRDWKKSPSATSGHARGGDGKPMNPGMGVVPLLRKIGERQYTVVGTGFYISRYGLLVSAAHVLAEFVDPQGGLHHGIVFDRSRDGTEAHIRRLATVVRNHVYDIGVAQADNQMYRFPGKMVDNPVATLSSEVAEPGTPVVTFAYPENALLDFDSEEPPMMTAGFFNGVVRRIIGPDERPAIPYPHYESSILVAGGASGGPVFDDKGRVIGVNCRGWDFGEDPGPEGELSSIVPIPYLLQVRIEAKLHIPEGIREYDSLGGAIDRPEGWSIQELVRAGHVTFDPQLPEVA